MKFAEIIPALLAGRKVKHPYMDSYIHISASGRLTHGDSRHDVTICRLGLSREDWELVKLPVADYLVPKLATLNDEIEYYVKESYIVGTQPEGAVYIPGSKRSET